MEQGRGNSERKGPLRTTLTPNETPTLVKMLTKCKTAETHNFGPGTLWNPDRCAYHNTTDHKSKTFASRH